MSSTFRRILPAGLTLVAVCLTGVALAWACTPAADISVDPGSGMPGTNATVSGAGFNPNVPIAIRWNGGPVLATATTSQAGTFGAAIRIPAGTPDTYTVVAAGGGGTATAAFTIVGGPTTSAPGNGAGSGAGRAPAGSNNSSGTTSGGNEAARNRARGGDSVTTSGGSPTIAGVGDRDASAPSARGTDRGAITLGSGQSVFADSAAQGQGKARSGASQAATSERSAAANLWAGFNSGARGILGSGTATPEAAGSMPAISMALLGLGLVAGLGGVGLAGARRRARARAGGQASSD